MPQPSCPGSGEAAVEVDRLVRPVEVADAEMDDAGLDPAAVVGGSPDALGQGGEIRSRAGSCISAATQAGISICTLTEAGGIALAKSNASTLSAKA